MLKRHTCLELALHLIKSIKTNTYQNVRKKRCTLHEVNKINSYDLQITIKSISSHEIKWNRIQFIKHLQEVEVELGTEIKSSYRTGGSR